MDFQSQQSFQNKTSAKPSNQSDQNARRYCRVGWSIREKALKMKQNGKLDLSIGEKVAYLWRESEVVKHRSVVI